MIVSVPNIGEDFETMRHMISGISEQAARTYHVVKGVKNTWAYAADVADPASYVYVDGGEGSRGFGGRKMDFKLVDGGSVQFTGPWHTNADALFRDTGVDLRDKSLTYCVIAEKRGPHGRLCNVLWRDDQPVVGHFDRSEVKALAQDFANKLGRMVHFYKESRGGSCDSPVEPIA